MTSQQIEPNVYVRKTKDSYGQDELIVAVAYTVNDETPKLAYTHYRPTHSLAEALDFIAPQVPEEATLIGIPDDKFMSLADYMV